MRRATFQSLNDCLTELDLPQKLVRGYPRYLSPEARSTLQAGQAVLDTSWAGGQRPGATGTQSPESLPPKCHRQ